MKLVADRININGKFVEFKSWKTGSFSLLNGLQYKNQLKAYMQAGNFEQVFDAKKLMADGIANPDRFVKEKIIDAIKKNADEFMREEQIRDFFIREGINDIKDININSSFIKRFKVE